MVKGAKGMLISRIVKKKRHEELPIIAFRRSPWPPIRPGLPAGHIRTFAAKHWRLVIIPGGRPTLVDPAP